MNIEIHYNGNMEEYSIYKKHESFPIKNMRANLQPYKFSEDDIYHLLGEKEYGLFEKGKYEFKVTKSHLDLVTGQRGAKNKQELLIYKD